jgi:hypothetical protein
MTRRLGQRFDSRDQCFVRENVRSQPFLYVNREQHTAVAVESQPGGHFRDGSPRFVRHVLCGPAHSYVRP